MTSDPTNWTDLRASLANWINREDLSAEIVEAIALAERRAQRTVFAPEREITTDLSVDAEAVDLPGDLWGMKALYLATNPKTVLEQMTLSELRRTYRASTAGLPRHYAIRGEQIVFGPAPDASYTGKLTYIQTIPLLGDTQPTNWLLTDHPDLYLYGSLHALYLLAMDEARAALYDGKFQQIVEELNRSGVRRSQGAAPIRIRAASVI